MEDEVAIPRITFVNPQGETLVVEARVGDSVMTTAKRLGVPGIRGDCGGFMACATCHVYVEESQLATLSPPGEMEDEMLWGTAAERRANSRLSCQIPVEQDTDLRVTLPPRQL